MSANDSRSESASEHIEMAKDVARSWIDKHAHSEFRMTVFFPSYEDSLLAKKYLRIATGNSEQGKIPKIANAKKIPGVDSITVISPDEKAMKLAKKALEKMGFEVDWGW